MDMIRAIIFEDGDLWVGQCLEVDIAAQGDDLKSVQDRLLVTIEAEAQECRNRGVFPFEGIDPAPQEYHDMWDQKASGFRQTTSIDGDRPLTVEQAVAA